MTRIFTITHRLISKIIHNTYTIIILAVIAYILFAFFSDVSKFTKTITESQIVLMPLILAPMVGSLLLLGIRFHRFLHALGIKTSLRTSIKIYFAGLSLLVTPAGAGQMIKSQIVKREFGDALSKTSPIVLIETWSSLSSALIIMILFFSIERIVAAQIIAVIGSVIAVMLAGIVKNQKFFNLFKRAVTRFRQLKKIEGTIENSRSTCSALMCPRIMMEGFLLTIPARLLEALCVFLVFQDLGFRLDYVFSTQIYFTSLISGMLSFIPGGFVITEGSMLGLLAKHGSSISAATTAVLFVRLSTIWFSTIIGLIAVRFAMKRKRFTSEGARYNQKDILVEQKINSKHLSKPTNKGNERIRMISLMKIRNSHKPTALVFLLFFLVMLSSSGGHLDVWDGKGYFLLTENLVKHHSLILHPDLIPPDDGQANFNIRNYFGWLHALKNEGNYLPPNSKLEPTASNASPLLAFIGVPFYIIAEIIHYSTVKFTSYFLNSLILALMSTVVFAFASDFYRSKKIGFALSLVAGVGSFAWPYVSSYLEQPLTALILISCLYFLYIASRSTEGISKDAENSNISSKLGKFSPVLAGLFLGLQSFAHPGTIMIVPGIAIIGAYIFRKDKAKFVQFFAAFFLLVGLQLYVNEVRFGSITEFGYGFTAGGTLTYAHVYTEGLYGFLISPGFGLIVYFPLIVLFPLSVYYLWRQNKVFCIAFLYVFFSIWIFYGTLQGAFWIGLGGWGPRYMITVVPVLALTSGSVLSVLSSRFTSADSSLSAFDFKLSCLFKNILKILFSTLAFSGFMINLLGVPFGTRWVLPMVTVIYM